MRIPEYKLTEIRNNPDDIKRAAMFFNSIFASTDEIRMDDDNMIYDIPDTGETYTVDIMNAYLLSLMKSYLNNTQYEVLRLYYGLDCDKCSAFEIAKKLCINVATANVRISQIKREAIDTLILNSDPSQIIDFNN